MKRSGLVPFYLLALAIASAAMVPGFVLPIGDVMGGLFRFIVEHKLYANILSIGRFAIEVNPWALLIFLFAAAPTLAALIVSSARGELRGLLRRFRPSLPPVSGMSAAKVYGGLFLSHLVVSATYWYFVRTQGTTRRARPGVRRSGSDAVARHRFGRVRRVD